MHSNARINLGCGRRTHPDWINVDLYASNAGVVQHDLRRPLPFESDSIEVAYHSHVLEHFELSEGMAFMKECVRVLKPGGVLRIVVPDLESICREYIRQISIWRTGQADCASDLEWMRIELVDQLARETPGGEMLRYLRYENIPNASFVISRLGDEAKSQVEKRRVREMTTQATAPLARQFFCFVVGILRNPQQFVTEVLLSKTNQKLLRIGRFRMAGEVHKWMYDEASIYVMLSTLGLVNITRCLASESRVEDWERIGLDVNDGKQPRKPDSIYMEATKPQIVR